MALHIEKRRGKGTSYASRGMWLLGRKLLNPQDPETRLATQNGFEGCGGGELVAGPHDLANPAVQEQARTGLSRKKRRTETRR